VSQPLVFSLANNSILVISPINSTILFLTISGFFECPSTGESIICETEADCLTGFPLVAIKHNSEFALVQ